MTNMINSIEAEKFSILEEYKKILERYAKKDLAGAGILTMSILLLLFASIAMYFEVSDEMYSDDRLFCFSMILVFLPFSIYSIYLTKETNSTYRLLRSLPYVDRMNIENKIQRSGRYSIHLQIYLALLNNDYSHVQNLLSEHRRIKKIKKTLPVIEKIGIFVKKASLVYSASGYESSFNYHRAAEIYEQLGMWEDARRCREKLNTPPTIHQYQSTIGRQHIQNMYSSGGSDKQQSFDFGDFFSYKILHKIGSGGFSDVYLVERDGRKFAMKIPKGIDLKGSDTVELREEDLEGYGKEAEIWATLTEKEPDAVVNLIDAGISPFPWFVMELGEKKLGDLSKDKDTEEKLRIAGELLEKLDRIHHYGIVHKDIKPENVLHVDGKWKFTDFGLSKVLSKSSKSSTGFSGTMLYMAPEQVSKKHFGNTDWRTDIWQMGVLIYEMLTGHLPFESEDAFEVTGMILRDEPVPATEYGVNESVWQAIRKSLEKKKDDRWQSALEFRRALEKKEEDR